MWQNRSAAPNIPISVTALNTFKQYSRLIHFCHTPLLFLPSWRLQSAATRDHSLSAQSSLSTGISLYQQLLWNKLLESKSAMNYNEFSELCSLAHVEPLLNLDPRLRPFINQPISWYQSLSKVLQNKYQEHHKQFNTPDGNITHLLILHPSFFQVFMMLTIDLHASRGDLYAVYCKSEEMINSSCCIEDTYNLIEGFVNACCFNLWMGLYN